MKRVAAEWLLLPVFAVPLLVAAALVVGARASYLATIEGYRAGGAATAQGWMDADPARVAHAIGAFDAAVAEAAGDGTDWEPFSRGGLRGFVRRPGALAGAPPWVLSADFPAGLGAAALADSAVRLGVETGTPIARSPGADPATVAFAGLVARPSVQALRSAELHAATKLHLLRRVDGAADDATILGALRDLSDALDAAGGHLVPGAHAAGDTRVFVPSAGAPLLVVPGGSTAFPAEGPATPLRTAILARDRTGTAELRWSAPGTAAPGDAEILWSGRLGTPPAGTWTIELPHGRAWWRTPQFTAWVQPTAIGCVAFLAIPTALLVALRRRRRLDEARARFVNEIAHDLRTPVAALRLHADLLASGRVPESERAKHEEIVGREAARLSSLLSNLLDLARLERASRSFERAPVDLAETARDAVREFRTMHPRRSGDVTIDAPDELRVTTDRTALARAVANLLDNAGKFTSAGTKVRVRVEPLGGSNGAAGARIVVEDEGPGIPPDERERVFLAYERGSAAVRTAAPGTGLGLALVRDLVRGAGGTVRLVDSPQGAAFEIVLPGAAHD